MRTQITIALTAALIVLLTGVSLPLNGESQEAGQPEMTPEMQAEMQAWMKYAEPGEHHQHLAPFGGKWKGDIKMWMAPDAAPMINETLAEARWILGGRFLEWTHSGLFDGSPFEGLGIEGYNNLDERYEGMWVDNFGTLIVSYSGACSDDGKSRIMTSEFSNPMTDEKIHQKVIYTWTDDDHFTYESYMKQGETEYRNMEITFARQ